MATNGEELTMVMIFSSTLPRWQLMNKGVVYTFRTHKCKKLGKDWANDGRCKPKLCDITKEFVKEITHARQLEPYVEQSGFLRLNAWISEIRRLNPKLKQIEGYLYKATKL